MEQVHSSGKVSDLYSGYVECESQSGRELEWLKISMSFLGYSPRPFPSPFKFPNVVIL